MTEIKNFNFDYVNFSDNDLLMGEVKTINNTDEYDETTTELYRILRIYKYDPISQEPIPNNLLFEFSNQWNPLTGIRTNIDIIGPLYFNAWNLYQYYYLNRFNGLWIPPIDDFQGYYGDLLGCGKDIIINSKPNPEKYLYRLPIIDCYLKKNHNFSLITMGPILTDEEIIKIDFLISNLRKEKPTLKLLKNYYDEAINNSPDILELKNTCSVLLKNELIQKYNRSFVDKLIKL